jgi:hypothetical protein
VTLATRRSTRSVTSRVAAPPSPSQLAPTAAALAGRHVLVAAACVLGLIAVLPMRATTTDGAAALPLLALVAIAVASYARRPSTRVAPARSVSARTAVVCTLCATIAVAALIVGVVPPRLLAGPVASLAIVGTYLAVWGLRSMALLRTTALLSLLVWSPIADAVHHIVRASLDQPSDRIYRRLAEIGVFGIDDAPWRLFSALLHRGALVVIATFVLCIALDRWSLDVRQLIETVVTCALALVAHHAVILATPIDAYRPSTAVALATNPVLEIALAVAAVVALELIRRRRSSRQGLPRQQPQSAAPATAERDPVIFGSGSIVASRVQRLALMSGMFPLALLALARAF